MSKLAKLNVHYIFKELNYVSMISNSNLLDRQIIPISLITSPHFITNNENIMRKVVMKDGMLLRYGSYDIKNNKNIVMHAILSNPNSLTFASDNMKNDYDILRLCIKKMFPTWLTY